MKSVSPKITTAIIGAAGEHFVMGELLRRGHIAALAPQGAPNMDILIADASGQRLFSIQVKTKTTSGRNARWPMAEKHEKITGKRLFYVFVDLGIPEGENPEYFIMPADVVAEVVRETHAAWARNPGRGGRKRNRASTMRTIRPDNSDCYTTEEPKYTYGWMEPYRNAWDYFQ